jgi:hypothetical protein
MTLTQIAEFDCDRRHTTPIATTPRSSDASEYGMFAMERRLWRGLRSFPRLVGALSALSEGFGREQRARLFDPKHAFKIGTIKGGRA